MVNDVKLCLGTGKRLNISASVLPSAQAANMADEKFLEFLLIRRPHVFQQKIRKSTFLSTALQKNRKRRRYRLLFILSVLTCTSIERRVWTLTRSGQWFEIVETAFIDKEWYDNCRVSKSTFDYIVREIQDEIV